MSRNRYLQNAAYFTKKAEQFFAYALYLEEQGEDAEPFLRCAAADERRATENLVLADKLKPHLAV